MKFRKKPVLIEAVQYRVPWEHVDGVNGVCFGITCDCPKQDNTTNGRPHLHTIHNDQSVLLEDGDWILPEPDGIHFYPCKPDIFEAAYEPIE
jgi:hypothetical protein